MRKRRKNKDLWGCGLWVARPWAEWDAVAMETEPYPVPFEMSRAGAKRTHKSESLISKAVRPFNGSKHCSVHIMRPQYSGKVVKRELASGNNDIIVKERKPFQDLVSNPLTLSVKEFWKFCCVMTKKLNFGVYCLQIKALQGYLEQTHPCVF